jgi:hypothetical protein
MMGRKIALGVVIVVVFGAGCSKVLDQFRSKHPDPPAGVFPPRVGNMVLEVSERWGKNPNCTRADPLHCWGYYVVPGGDNEATRIDYFMQIYDSPDDAKTRMEAYAGEVTSDSDVNTWEDGGQKVGKVLIKNTVRRDGDSIFGVCSASYTRGEMFITITHRDDCKAAREFLNDLAAIIG